MTKKTIDRKKLTPIFKKVLRDYKKINTGQVTVHDVTAALLSYMFTGRATMTLNLLDMQELMHFIKVMERDIYGKKKK